ncbi:MAG: hypothetical protein V1817_04630 [Candidatus Micrarchaeota archaeon]
MRTSIKLLLVGTGAILLGMGPTLLGVAGPVIYNPVQSVLCIAGAVCWVAAWYYAWFVEFKKNIKDEIVEELKLSKKKKRGRSD